MEITEVFKALADTTRIRMVNVLFAGGTMCSCNIETILDISQVNSSRHLAKLKSAKIIKAEKKAQWVYYSLNDEFINKYTFLRETFQNNIYDDLLKKDLETLDNFLKSKTKC